MKNYVYTVAVKKWSWDRNLITVHVSAPDAIRACRKAINVVVESQGGGPTDFRVVSIKETCRLEETP